MNLEIPESLFDSFQIILKYQNTLLLKEIAKDKGWKLSELKKEYLKTEDVSTLVKKYNKKKKKENKNKNPPSKPETEDDPSILVNENTQILESQNTNEVIELHDDEKKENVVIEIKDNNDLKPPKTIKIPQPDKKVKKKKIKKIIKDTEIKCHKYTIEDMIFYINVENNNAYDNNMEFVGRMVGNMINFNEDEL
jgi:hypothetical protein